MDFVLYGPKGLLAFEIKRSRNCSPRDLNGLKAFRKDYPMATCCLLYGGEHVREADGIRILPMDQALKTLPDLLAPAQGNGSGINSLSSHGSHGQPA